MQDVLSGDDSAVLARLWCRRQRLTPEDMALGYGLVQRALAGCSPPEVAALGESKQELIAQFIYLKVLRLEHSARGDDGLAEDTAEARNGHSAPSNGFALCAYFRRYVIDCTRAVGHRRKQRLDDGNASVDAVLTSQATELDGDDPAATLTDYGLSESTVAMAARRFIRELPAAERLLLTEGFAKEKPGGLAGVATRHAIASYHYRAGRLGLVHRRAALPADYAKTWLGTWIEQVLGVPIIAENRGAIGCIFEILAAEASWA